MNTHRLLLEAHTAPPEARARLQDEVIRLNMRLASDLSRRYQNRGISQDDLEQVAYLGLVKAVHGFAPDKASDFLSYAVPTIRGELRRHFRDQGWMVRPPRAIQELQARLGAAESELHARLDRAPRPSELARHLGVEESVVVEALAANGCFTPTSLDAEPSGGEGATTLADRLGSQDPAFAAAEARAMLVPVIRSLTERERLVLELRFFRGCTQSEIGRRLGVTQTQVSRVLSGLLSRLREQLTVDSAHAA